MLGIRAVVRRSARVGSDPTVAAAVVPQKIKAGSIPKRMTNKSRGPSPPDQAEERGRLGLQDAKRCDISKATS